MAKRRVAARGGGPGKAASGNRTGVAASPSQARDAAKSDTTPFMQALVLLCLLLAAGAGWWTLYKDEPDDRRTTPLMQMARAGRLTDVRRLLAPGGGGLADLNVVDEEHMNALSHSLYGKFSRLQSNPMAATGDHDAVFQLLLATPGVNASVSCPLYYAVHFKMLAEVRSLLEHMRDHHALHGCLVELDAGQETILHVALRDKPSGLARLLLRLRDPITQSQQVPGRKSAALNVLRSFGVAPPSTMVPG